MSYELVPLGELGEIVAGSTPDTNNQKYWGGDIAWITPADLTSHEGIYFTGKLRKITEAGYKSCSTKMLPAGSILFSSRAPIGHCAVTSFPLCTNQGFKSIIPNEKLDSVYGFFALKYFTPQIEALGRGATFAEVNKEIFENFAIPLPPLTEQKRIASLLARADRLRSLRRTAHELGESLLQSVFLEMFGNIERNDKGWEKHPISKYVNVQGGYSFKSSDFIRSGVKVVKITNVHYGQLTWQDDTEFLPANFLEKYSAFSLQAGDIVMSLTRPIIKSLNTVKVCRVQETDKPCLLNQRVGRLIIKNPNKIVPEYLLHFCYSQHFKKKVDDFLSESLQPNISINQVGEIEIPVPPLNLQEEFAGVVARVESLRGRMGESTRQVEGLFESLLVEAFDGC